ncbi:hypothetical protein PoB_002161600 [Plakobranchus ocellatus]|uniref:Uncharacterized protein n=1 Tax=Plakobranchus ocellatus TaxID=259542 RepID=A0AAV3ZKQ2_9GAST|nr:hypothetical protein PoB_002161600 [Plakobranchus ocellatus]
MRHGDDGFDDAVVEVRNDVVMVMALTMTVMDFVNLEDNVTIISMKRKEKRMVFTVKLLQCEMKLEELSSPSLTVSGRAGTHAWSLTFADPDGLPGTLEPWSETYWDMSRFLSGPPDAKLD